MGVSARRTPGPAAVVALLLLAATARADALGAPAPRGGRAAWCVPDACPAPARRAPPPPDPGAAAFAAGDSLAGWAARAAVDSLPPFAIREYARACAARGDAARADSALASPRLAASRWAWSALSQRADLALAAGDSARADSLLGAAATRGWPDAERAAWGLRRARLAAARGDSAAAEDRATAVVKLFPSLGASGPALRLLDTLWAARGEPLPVDLERAGAESDALRGARLTAAARLRHLLPREEEADRWKVAVRLAEVLRAARQTTSARGAADSALALAPAGEPQARARLERARALRDAGATDAALAEYARAADAGGPLLRANAWWEYARECEDERRWSGALYGLRRAAEAGGRRAAQARVRAGIVQLARGEPDSARAFWWGSSDEAARFWLGVSLRRSQPAVADSLLRGLAALPGYAFYRAAARETLGVAGWRGAIAAAAPPPGPGTALTLLAWGDGDAAVQLLGRAESASPLAWLGAADAAFRAGRPAQGTRWAERAFGLAEDAGDDSLAWAAVPWAYPPAYEELVVAAESLGVDRALLWALIRQESRFQPEARSVSNALGLTQLLRPTAGDVARWFRDPQPTEETLFAPDTSVRYGARYLAWLLGRFGNVPAVALAAYNAGPGTIRSDWRALLDRGGEALFAEFASNADSQDYVKRITGFRSAYRELRPTTSP